MGRLKNQLTYFGFFSYTQMGKLISCPLHFWHPSQYMETAKCQNWTSYTHPRQGQTAEIWLSTAIRKPVTPISCYLRFVNVGMEDFIHESCNRNTGISSSLGTHCYKVALVAIQLRSSKKHTHNLAYPLCQNKIPRYHGQQEEMAPTIAPWVPFTTQPSSSKGFYCSKPTQGLAIFCYYWVVRWHTPLFLLVASSYQHLGSVLGLQPILLWRFSSSPSPNPVRFCATGLFLGFCSAKWLSHCCHGLRTQRLIYLIEGEEAGEWDTGVQQMPWLSAQWWFGWASSPRSRSSVAQRPPAKQAWNSFHVWATEKASAALYF